MTKDMVDRKVLEAARRIARQVKDTQLATHGGARSIEVKLQEVTRVTGLSVDAVGHSLKRLEKSGALIRRGERTMVQLVD